MLHVCADKKVFLPFRRVESLGTLIAKALRGSSCFFPTFHVACVHIKSVPGGDSAEFYHFTLRWKLHNSRNLFHSFNDLWRRRNGSRRLKQVHQSSPQFIFNWKLVARFNFWTILLNGCGFSKFSRHESKLKLGGLNVDRWKVKLMTKMWNKRKMELQQ